MSKISNDVEAGVKPTSFFVEPVVGSVLTVLSGLSFLFVCMILPLVGKAGSATVHAGLNTMAFAASLILTLVMAALATWSKLARRHLDQSPLPYFSIILVALSALLLLALATGLLRI